MGRFAREARFLERLVHPNIVRVRAVLELGHAGLAIVMAYVPGRTLKELIRKEGRLAPERAERFTGGWDGQWFAEDYCEGPGQALIINPKGEVKPCCGFASDLDQLTIGNIHEHSVAQIIRRARQHPYVGKVFRQGLTAIRDEILARDPDALPGATSNHCFFCWHVLTRGLAGMPGGARYLVERERSYSHVLLIGANAARAEAHLKKLLEHK